MQLTYYLINAHFVCTQSACKYIKLYNIHLTSASMLKSYIFMLLLFLDSDCIGFCWFHFNKHLCCLLKECDFLVMNLLTYPITCWWLIFTLPLTHVETLVMLVERCILCVSDNFRACFMHHIIGRPMRTMLHRSIQKVSAVISCK